MRKQAVNLEGLAERLRLRVVALELGGAAGVPAAGQR